VLYLGSQERKDGGWKNSLYTHTNIDKSMLKPRDVVEKGKLQMA